ILVHLSLGQTPLEASKSAIQELTPALIGSTLTPIVVFLPLVFLGGITAVFFRALALALVAALMASLILAIFFTPVLAAGFLKPRAVAAETDLAHAEVAGEGKYLTRLTAYYERALAWSLGHAVFIVGAAVVILIASFGIYTRLGSGFLPEMDEGAFVLDYIMPAGTSLQETDRVLLQIEKLLRA